MNNEIEVAYCIICHKNSRILEECVEILGQTNDIYIHVDKKKDIFEFNNLRNKAKFIQERVEVAWGGYSIIEATLKLLRETQNKKYDYIFVISGECLPLKSDYEIKKFLKEKKGSEFIEKSDDIKFMKERLKYCYSNIFYKKNKNILEKIYTKISKGLLKKNKYYKELPKIYGGANWFGITSQFRDYVFKFLDENENYKKAFYNSYCGDELFFQTIAFNSEYKDKIYNFSVRYVDWKTGPEYPRVLKKIDFSNIAESNSLFARKFDENLNLGEYREFFRIDKVY